LHLFALACNLANFLQQLVLTKPIKGWNLPTRVLPLTKVWDWQKQRRMWRRFRAKR
jgi:hypothetical protein